MPGTVFAFILVLAALVVPLTQQQYTIAKLTTPVKISDTERACTELAREFALSARELEVLGLLARGMAPEGVSKKLVVSPHTVNARIRHIYKKMDIHKRSELFDYINNQRLDG